MSVGAAFPDLAINGRGQIASTSFAVYRPQARNFVVPADGHRGTSVAVVLLHQRVLAITYIDETGRLDLPAEAQNVLAEELAAEADAQET